MKGDLTEGNKPLDLADEARKKGAASQTDNWCSLKEGGRAAGVQRGQGSRVQRGECGAEVVKAGACIWRGEAEACVQNEEGRACRLSHMAVR